MLYSPTLSHGIDVSHTECGKCPQAETLVRNIQSNMFMIQELHIDVLGTSSLLQKRHAIV